MAKDYTELSKEELLKVIEKLESRKKYGLVWEDKAEDVALRCQTELPILTHLGRHEIRTKGDSSFHFLIEGDNYHSLSVLNFTHRGKVDLIYVDPPYNTENKDFKYNDTFVDKKDAYRHSKWLSFFSKRLKLARNLLKDDGSIFISINEEELAQLKLLCDEVFGEKNYLACFTIKVRHEERILKGDKDFHEVVEYLLFYRKTDLFIPHKRQFDNTSIDEYLFQVEELTDKPQIVEMNGKAVQVFSPGQFKITKGNPDLERLKKISIRGSIKEGNSSGRFYMKKLDSLKNSKRGHLYKVPDMGDDALGYRYFLIPDSSKRSNGDYFQGVPQNRKDIKEVPYPNYFDFVNDFNNVGYEGGVEFRNGKKPISFIKKLFEISNFKNKKDGVVLDFFAGSGSTGHALLELNKVDGGNRSFILCTNNENSICSNITYPRIKKTIRGYKIQAKGKYVMISGTGGNLRYMKTNFVKKTINKDDLKIRITHACTEMLCLRERVFDALKQTDEYRIFKQAGRVMGIYYALDRGNLKMLKNELDKLEGDKVMYCFTLDPLGLDEKDFIDWKDVRLEPIPQKILDVYEEIYEQHS